MTNTTHYLAFSEKLKCDRYLYSLRDALHAACHYRMAGHSVPRRHNKGLWSWLAWALAAPKFPVARGPGEPVAPPSAAVYDFFALEMRDAHWGSLLPVALDFQRAGEHLRIWIPGTAKSPTGLEGLPNVQIGVSDDCIQKRRTPPRFIFGILKRILRLARHLNLGWSDADASKLAQVLWDFESSKALWENLLKRFPSKGCFLTSEGGAYHKGIVAAYRSSGARVFHVCHGLPWEYHANSNATDIVPFSKIDAKWFRERASKDIRIHKCGNPRMSQIYKDFASRRPAFSSGLPIRILFLSNGMEDTYTAEQAAQDLSILGLPSDLRKQTTLRVRPHPREDRARLKEALSGAGLEIDTITEGTLTDDLEWADVCATPWSTSLLEAMVAGRACFWTNARNDRMCGTGDFIDNGIGTLVKTPSEWAFSISRLLHISEHKIQHLLNWEQLAQAHILAPDDSMDWSERLLAQ